MDDTQYDQLVRETYPAALEPGLWESVLIHIADQIQADGGNYFVANAQRGSLVFST